RTPAYAHTLSHEHPIVAFEGVRVPAANRVGAEGDGMTFAYEWFRFERLMVAARCLGAADRLVVESTSFAQQRIVRGEPLIERQLVQGMLADSLTELFAARSMVYAVARAIDDGVDRKVAHAQCRSSAAAATCARTSRSGSAARSGSSGSGRAPARSSGSSSPTS